jgi:nucleoside-diphosphate-sugar epimerase
VPVLIVGADHPVGLMIATRLAAPNREVRAFISSPDLGPRLRELAIKVAVGDLSDQSHVAAAATRCFSIVMIEAALSDGRELAFADAESTRLAWSRAATEAAVTRAIWVGDYPPPLATPESAVVPSADRAEEEVVAEAVSLDEIAVLPGRSDPA